MSIFNFLKDVGQKLSSAAGGAEAPKAEDLKREMDSHNIGTQSVNVVLEGAKAVLSGVVKDRAAFEKAVLAAGNPQGIAQVDTSGLTIENPDGKEAVFYTVKSGDTLWKIAEAQYGKGQGGKNTLIFEANKPMLTSPDKIYPGQVLRIPPLS